jgi:hypothetical protein
VTQNSQGVGSDVRYRDRGLKLTLHISPFTLHLSTSTLPEISLFAARLGIAGLALLLYLAACAMPALEFEQIENLARGPAIMKGYETALLGWQALFAGNFGWLANLPFAIGLVFVLTGSWRPAAVCCGIALLLALDSLLLMGERIKADESGLNHMVLSRLYPGFYLWLTSIAAALFGSIWLRGQSRLA